MGKRIAGLAVLTLTMAGAASAGSTPAGPAAAGSTGVGAAVVPQSSLIHGTLPKDDSGRTLRAGDGGTVTLSRDQIATTAAALRSFSGAVVDGATIRAPTVLQDNTHATITLDTATGELRIVRVE